MMILENQLFEILTLTKYGNLDAFYLKTCTPRERKIHLRNLKKMADDEREAFENAVKNPGRAPKPFNG